MVLAKGNSLSELKLFLISLILYSMYSVYCANRICSEPRRSHTIRNLTRIVTYMERCSGNINCMKTKLSYSTFYGAHYYDEKICCSGYYRSDETSDLQCLPKCDDVCINGECTAPNTCTCKAGYLPNPETKFRCHPVCATECINSTCISPNTCKCNAGYGPDMVRPYACHPECPGGCMDGTCDSPGVCSCAKGYYLNVSKTSSDSCMPECEPTCENGVCVDVNKCLCEPGYEKTNQEHVCTATCKGGCSNGTCTAPERCECNEGFRFDDYSLKSCLPHCSISCGNGTCTNPDTCECDDGYEISESSTNTEGSRCILKHLTSGSSDASIWKSTTPDIAVFILLALAILSVGKCQ